MLELKKIKKDYPAGEGVVHALKGINLRFRRSEFVSILGPSGCGKTTTLNIIGGLDQYTSGDLMINGKSTKDFKDRDWDTYRNHSIGFVFQSYNLIPHQTVLQNVELALTLSGVSKTERRNRAKKALEDVGLGNQLSKRPSEMSGGQMQRVAIARALVNNPDIILADEPTGALDTETSVQVMEILKKISKDRLIIMVTHNPELAEQYSSRIIRMLDGEVTQDSAPLSEEEYKNEQKRDKEEREKTGKKKKKQPSMSFGTSFSLSLKNLFTKKGRTALTSFAGSIGIIGIALVLSISQGFSTYIDVVQEETLSSYPLTIEKTNTDLSSLMETFMGVTEDNAEHGKDAIYKKSAVYEIVEAMNNLETYENDLKAFKKYLETEYANTDSENGLYEAINGIQYSYSPELLVYTKNIDGTIIRSDAQELMQDLLSEHLGMDMSSMMDARSSILGSSSESMMSMGGSSMLVWQEMLPGDNGRLVSDLLEKQYDVVYGNWPADYNEIVLVVDENNELDDMTLYALGLETKEQMDNIMDAAVDGKELEKKDKDKKWSFEEICDMEFRTVLNSDCFRYDENTGYYSDLRETEAGLQYLYDNAMSLKVTGIIRPKEDTTSTILSGSIGYTSKLTEYVIEHSKESDAIQAQLEDEHTDIFTGLPFKETTGDLADTEKETEFRNYIEGLDEKTKAETYVKMMSIPSDKELAKAKKNAKKGLKRKDMEDTLLKVLVEQMGMSENDVADYVVSMSDEDIEEYFDQIVTEQVKMQYAEQVTQQLSAAQPVELAAMLEQAMDSYDTEQCATYYDEIMEFSETTYDDNLVEMGYVDLDDPSAINIYASTFENKDIIEDAIEAYNEDKDEVSQIKYTDYVGLMMSSITSIINTITYVLIAFVAISLIVSSIMIGVITLISVQERTKEIGILRAIGASKSNVSSMFNAETVIIGFTSGLLGVVITCLMCIPINMVIHELTGINNLNAILPLPAALILVAISMILTLIAGIIPSKSAAKKDPVVALHSE